MKKLKGWLNFTRTTGFSFRALSIHPSIHPNIQPLYRITGPFKGYPRWVTDHPIIFTLYFLVFTSSTFHAHIHKVSKCGSQLFHVRLSVYPMNLFALNLDVTDKWSRDIVFSIATGYGPVGPVIESRLRRDFPHLSRPALGPTQLPIKWASSFFPESKAAGTWRCPPTPSIADVKGNVELYLYSHSEPSWPVLGWTYDLQLRRNM